MESNKKFPVIHDRQWHQDHMTVLSTKLQRKDAEAYHAYCRKHNTTVYQRLKFHIKNDMERELIRASMITVPPEE